MKTIEIRGRHCTPEPVHTRIACRGLIYRDGKVLLSHELITGWYLIPGGGLEGRESIEECCIREMQEETGWQVRPLEQILQLTEYYGDWCYISHYFLCQAISQGEPQLTELEAQRGLTGEWVDIRQAEAIFADHVNLTHHEEKRGSYKREHLAILTFLETILCA